MKFAGGFVVGLHEGAKRGIVKREKKRTSAR